MRDIINAFDRGGRIVAHHLEFDSAYISKELERCNLKDLRKKWLSMVTLQKGFCTMDPTIGRWVAQCINEEPRGENAKQTMPLRKLMEKFRPDQHDLLEKHHQANADAQMHRLVFIALANHARKAGGMTAVNGD